MQNKKVTLALALTAAATIGLFVMKLIAEEATLYGLAILLLLSFIPSLSTKEIKFKAFFLVFFPVFIVLLFFINYLYR